MNPPRDRTPSAVETPDLWAALDGELQRFFDGRRRLATLLRRPSAYRSSFPIEELDLSLDDGTRLALMFKDLGWRALTAAGRQAKPAFLYDPLREIEMYRAVLAGQQIGTAVCYGAAVDHPRRRYWLFLERVVGQELYQIGELIVWQRVARWLARLHDRLAGQAEAVARGRTVPLIVYDAELYRRWMRRALAFSSRTEAARARAVAWLAGRYERVVEYLVALPATIIHGELYASNVLVHQHHHDFRVCPIDWEMAARGPGLVDLAALVAGGWADEERHSLAVAYHAAISPDAAWRPPLDAFLEALQYSRLHLAVQWLGWAAEWSPPAEHRHDWLGEAVELAERLGL